MSKNLILTSCVNYNWDNLKEIVVSFRAHNKEDDMIVVFHDKPDEKTVENLAKYNVGIASQVFEDPGRVVVNRFKSYSECLRQNVWKYVCLFDANDIYFQKNPFDWIESNIGNSSIISSSESIRYRDEVWGNENLRKSFPEFYDILKDNLIFNAGTIAGTQEGVAALAEMIYMASKYNPVYNPDQAAYNFIIQTVMKDRVKFTTMEDAWGCQCGTTANTERMHRPDSMFAEKIVENEPQILNDLICNHAGQPFSVVHQYHHSYTFKDHVAKMVNKWQNQE